MNSNVKMLPEAGHGLTAPPAAIIGFAAPIKAGKTKVTTLVAERSNSRRSRPAATCGGWRKRKGGK